MNVHELIDALKSHKAECYGCGYEHNCKDGHCALMVQAADELERLNAFEGSQSRKDNQMEISEIISGLKDLIKDREALMGVFAHDKAVLETAVEMLNKQSDEKGLTVKLPCKLGDKVYYIEYHAKNPIKSGTVWQYGIGEDGIWCSISVSKSKAIVMSTDMIYLTRESAEQALANHTLEATP